ncbi:MAG: hypothetical protein WCJ30_03420 [Deltaproteobacteria bacterium]
MVAQFEILADCPVCLCEGSLIEVYDLVDPASSLGIPADARCRLCCAAWSAVVVPGPGSIGVAARGSGRCPCCGHTLLEPEVQAHACGQCGSRARAELTRSPDSLGDRAAIDRALARFADEESERDVAAFVASNFTAETADGVLAAVLRREPIETSFAAMHTLFNRHGGRGAAAGGGGSSAVRDRRESRVPDQLGPGVHLPVPPPPAYDTQAMLHALVSIVVADGEIDAEERHFIEAFAAREGLAPPGDHDYQMHRPVEIAGRVPPDRRLELLERMTELACLDGVADSSEMRIVRAYAAIWSVEDQALGGWVEKYRLARASRGRRWMLRVKDFFLAPPPPEQDERTASAAKR